MALVEYEQKEFIGTITLNDPDNLNAMGEPMAAEFAECVETIRTSDAKPRCLILTGAGRAFSAGGNLEMLKKKSELSGDENRQRMLKFYDSFLRVLSFH